MINASASGWINKFFLEQGTLKKPITDYPEAFYKRIRSTGFVYGHIISFDTREPINSKGWITEEISKVALLNTLYATFEMVTEQIDSKIFINVALNFYKKIHPETFNLLKKILPEDNATQSLEKIMKMPSLKQPMLLIGCNHNHQNIVLIKRLRLLAQGLQDLQQRIN